MATDLQNPSEQQNISALVTGILHDAEELIRQQVKLIRHEVKEDFRKTKEAAVPMGIGLWLAVVGSILLSVAVALGLVEAGLLLPWSSFAIVGGTVALVGGGLFYVGKKKLASFNPLPDESAEALKENLEWIAKPK